MDALTQDTNETGDDKIVKEARALYLQLSKAQEANRKEQELDMQYIAGEQWTADERTDRESNGRPCFTVNRITPSVNVVVNNMLQNVPSIEVSPNGDGAEVDTAEVIANLIRGIEQESNAESAYGNAGFYQVAIGAGYFRIGSRYIDEKSFDQELVIKQIDNPFTVLFDESSVEPDGKDADVVLVVKDLSPYEYKNKFGKSSLAEAMNSSSWITQLPGMLDWASDSMVRVVEYWKRVYEPASIYLVETVDFLTMERISVESTETKPSEAEMDVEYVADLAKRGMPAVLKRIINERKTFEIKVMQYLVNGIEVLEKSEFPGRYIPIIPVRGDAIYANGHRHVFGMVRAMRDPQKLYNLQANAQVETLALAPKSPFIGYPEQIEGYEQIWEQANSQNFAFLPIKKVAGLEGVMPQRQNSEPAIQAVMATRASFAEDLKAVTGVYDAALGLRQGEESGKAILARQSQTETANWKYSNNLKRAIKHAGRILVDIIPHFYDTERMVKIVKPTGEAELMAVNTYSNSPVLGDLGDQKRHDLTVGKYDVVVNTGKSYATQRAEAVDSMLELGRAAPDKLPLIADLIVANMDWSGAKAIAKRLRADLEMNMPGLLEATGESGEDGIDAEVKLLQVSAKIKQMEQALEQAVSIAENLKDENEDLKQDNSHLRTNAQVDLVRAEMDRDLKLKQLELEEQKAIQSAIQARLNYQIAMAKIEDEKSRTAVQAVRAASQVNAEMFDREMEQEQRAADRIQIEIEPENEPDQDQD